MQPQAWQSPGQPPPQYLGSQHDFIWRTTGFLRKESGRINTRWQFIQYQNNSEAVRFSPKCSQIKRLHHLVLGKKNMITFCSLGKNSCLPVWMGVWGTGSVWSFWQGPAHRSCLRSLAVEEPEGTSYGESLIQNKFRMIFVKFIFQMWYKFSTFFSCSSGSLAPPVSSWSRFLTYREISLDNFFRKKCFILK